VEFIALCLLAIVLGVRGYRADRRPYLWTAGAAVIAALYTYHQQ
jgi:hypothetical protein